MVIWPALVLGFLGSFHCIGMCGPIALALPVQRQNAPVRFVLGRVLYNLGRVLTYALFGLAIGAVGQVISLAGYQQSLSIALGVLLLLSLVFYTKMNARILPVLNKLTGRWKAVLGALLKKHSNSALFLIGVLNGFLPCGLVYAALAGAAATGNAGNGALFMATFGFGTLPVMLIMSLLGKLISQPFRHALNRLIPAVVVVIALILILRGLSLGIPYLSPVLQNGGMQH